MHHLHANYGHKNSYLIEWITFVAFCIPLIGVGPILYYSYKRGKAAEKGLVNPL
jgi:hypothetical protein